MTRNNARIIAKYLREAGWSEVTALRQQLAAGKARVQEMGRHNATEAEHFRAICRRIDDWVSLAKIFGDDAGVVSRHWPAELLTAVSRQG